MSLPCVRTLPCESRENKRIAKQVAAVTWRNTAGSVSFSCSFVSSRSTFFFFCRPELTGIVEKVRMPSSGSLRDDVRVSADSVAGIQFLASI